MNLKPADSTTQIENKEEWWRTWFNTIYLDVYAHRNDAQARDEIYATLSALPIEPQHRIVDLCCGNGRHSRALFESGFHRVIGIDYSYPLLKYARLQNAKLSFIRGDMRRMPLADRSADVLLTFFTSFGYFQTNTENLLVLREIARVLKPGGWFLLDYLNPDHVKAHFEPESHKKYDEFEVVELRRFTHDGERIEKEIVIKNWGNRDRTFFESVRLYTYSDMTDMLSGVDLRVQECLGAFDLSPFNSDSPRMILYGTKA